MYLDARHGDAAAALPWTIDCSTTCHDDRGQRLSCAHTGARLLYRSRGACTAAHVAPCMVSDAAAAAAATAGRHRRAGSPRALVPQGVRPQPCGEPAYVHAWCPGMQWRQGVTAGAQLLFQSRPAARAARAHSNNNLFVKCWHCMGRRIEPTSDVCRRSCAGEVEVQTLL